MKRILRGLVRLLYGFRSYNEQALAGPGPVLLLPNHVSWLDWLFLGVCLEDDWRFVTSSTTAQISWLHRRIMVNRRTFPVDVNSPYAVKHMAEYLQQGGRLVLFPEGRLSCTGSLMKLFDGTGFLICKTHARVLTAYIRGADRLPLSPNPNRKQWFPRVSVHFSDVLPPPDCGSLSASGTRVRLTEWVREQMVRQRFETEMAVGATTVPAAILATARQRRGQLAVQDVTLEGLTYRRLLIGAEALAGQWRTLLTGSPARVGVLLPNTNAFPIVLLSLWAENKVPAVLNYTMGPAVLEACVRLAGLKQVITSKTFVARARLDLEPLARAGVGVVFLEDVRARITRGQRVAAFLRQAWRTVPRGDPQPGDVAVVLFTSGSEGDPKGVELTHRNLLANMRQMVSVIDVMDTDRFFNALPLFHCFGLTVGLLLPLVAGSRVVLYVSPLHYRVVPAACYNLDCTILFGTNTLLNGYARKAHPYDFRTVRYVFAGAEKLQESTSALWMQKFGVRILEGYGATECSPCLTVNVPMHPRQGSPGQFLPGIEFKLEPVPGIGGAAPAASPVATPAGEDAAHPASAAPVPRSDGAGAREPAAAGAPAGRLFVRGPNVMRGYLNAAANERFQALGGWYDTGDIARVDGDGFVYILGRLKRFAKISGEMISLTALEDALAGAFPEFGPKFAIAVVSRPDPIKGEKLIAVSNEPQLTIERIREALRARGFSNLAAPKAVRCVHELPRLGTGKIDHRRLEAIEG